MNQIWSPWRMEYMQQSEKNEDCIFCKAFSQTDGPENLIVFRGELAFVILNRYPYTSGHAMIVPYAHQPTLDALNPDIRAELIELCHLTIQVLQRVYDPQAFNLGVNIGKASGAGIADHIHFHVVPRWAGDTNFMSTVGDTRVLPEDLPSTYQRIRSAWDTAPNHLE